MADKPPSMSDTERDLARNARAQEIRASLPSVRLLVSTLDLELARKMTKAVARSPVDDKGLLVWAAQRTILHDLVEAATKIARDTDRKE